MNKELKEAMLKNLNSEWDNLIKILNDHTKKLGNQYCECGDCELFRRELGEVRTWINKVNSET